MTSPPTPADVDQILAEAAVALTPDVVAARIACERSFAGLRVLPAGEGESVSARRETVYSVEAPAECSTSPAASSRRTVGSRSRRSTAARPSLGCTRSITRPWPLPGAVGLDARPCSRRSSTPTFEAHLLHLYGSRCAADVLAPARRRPVAARAARPGRARHRRAGALRRRRTSGPEAPTTSIRRRTTLFYRGLESPAVVSRVEGLLAGT